MPRSKAGLARPDRTQMFHVEQNKNGGRSGPGPPPDSRKSNAGISGEAGHLSDRAASAQEIEAKRKAFVRKWRLRCKAVADSLAEAGDRLFAFARFPPSQWKSIRTTNAIERLHEEFKRRIKTQTVLPSAETAAMLFWALLASGQTVMRKVGGRRSLAERPSDQIIDLAA